MVTKYDLKIVCNEEKYWKSKTQDSPGPTDGGTTKKDLRLFPCGLQKLGSCLKGISDLYAHMSLRN